MNMNNLFESLETSNENERDWQKLVVIAIVVFLLWWGA